MAVSLETLETNLRNAIPIMHLEIIDQSNGCGENYEILVVSEAFEKKTTLARHRLINELLKNEIAEMHAFSQVCLTNHPMLSSFLITIAVDNAYTSSIRNSTEQGVRCLNSVWPTECIENVYIAMLYNNFY
ncbi:bola-like protein [Fomitiporia mediterranea MF3/22]|uniref:bola-like protein n=1 Tax=Fomitiporia mediterranea (strain MF3/22) TaxID=694068 RepID=UPI00044081B9|nr:bola-like protein [Fomitiporia mediterranea MF3/22]EJD06102.1 bola-like protein [Fomitiporia mediterranea MF3/22]